MKCFICLLAVLIAGFHITSCSMMARPQGQTSPSEAPAEPQEGTTFVNPYPAGSLANLQARPDYLKTYDVWRNVPLLQATNASNSSLLINLTTQRAQLMNNGQVAMDYPVSTGKSTHPTPPGNYKILEKIKDKRSNIYGKIYNSSGSVVNSDAHAKKDKIPAGGKFVGASMPYWMRLTWTGVGHHVGRVPRYPASHACIRGPKKLMPEIYSKVKVGTPVQVVKKPLNDVIAESAAMLTPIQ